MALNEQQNSSSLFGFLSGWTVSKKMWLSIGFMVFLLVVSGGISYFLIQKINADLTQIIDVEEPLEQAILEMEINVGKTTIAVLDYIRELDPKHIKKVHDSEADFEKFSAVFEKLVETDGEKQFGQEVAKLYLEFKDLGEQIIFQAKE